MDNEFYSPKTHQSIWNGIYMHVSIVFIQASHQQNQDWEILLSLLMRRNKKRRDRSSDEEINQQVEDPQNSSINYRSLMVLEEEICLKQRQFGQFPI